VWPAEHLVGSLGIEAISPTVQSPLAPWHRTLHGRGFDVGENRIGLSASWAASTLPQAPLTLELGPEWPPPSCYFISNPQLSPEGQQSEKRRPGRLVNLRESEASKVH
jgi:hypothetical protein